MFITRATRHDKDDIQELLSTQGRTDSDLSEGVTYFARDGGVIGCVRLIEVEPQTVVVDDVLVAEARRGQGIGRELMKAAMNALGGKLYPLLPRRARSRSTRASASRYWPRPLSRRR